jgi:hypothetical protein
MPVHDWTRVSDGTFHDFHYSWVLEIKRALKRGLLPAGYYVMAEQIGGDNGAIDVEYAKMQRSLVIRRLHGARIVARIEVRFAGNKSHPIEIATYVGGAAVEAFVQHFAVGEAIPFMPLFLTSEHYVRVPLEEAYMAAWEDVPEQYQWELTAAS